MKEPNKVIELLIKQNGDMSKTRERFLNDGALYIECLCAFVNSEEFEKLGSAIAAQSKDDIFSNAYNLKGVAGNLGLSKLFDCFSILLQQLPLKQYDTLSQWYQIILEERKQLKNILTDENPPSC